MFLMLTVFTLHKNKIGEAFCALKVKFSYICCCSVVLHLFLNF